MMIHGLRNWTKNSRIGEFHTIHISCSLHKPGWTVPFRPFGYVLCTSKTGIIAAYAKDACSKVISGKKYISRKMYNYKNNLEDLIAVSPKGSHNELILSVDFIKIIGYYGQHKKFTAACKTEKLTFYEI